MTFFHPLNLKPVFKDINLWIGSRRIHEYAQIWVLWRIKQFLSFSKFDQNNVVFGGTCQSIFTWMFRKTIRNSLIRRPNERKTVKILFCTFVQLKMFFTEFDIDLFFKIALMKVTLYDTESLIFYC